MSLKIAFFNTKSYDEEFFTKVNASYHYDLQFFKEHLNPRTAILAQGCDAVCAFVNDDLSQKTLQILQQNKIPIIAMRCAGVNNVDIEFAKKNHMHVLNVPSYSPYAIAEHAVALMLILNRKIHRAHMRVHEGNFSLEGLLGFDMHGKTVGILGTGKIGTATARILLGMGCEVLGFDKEPNTTCKEMGVHYVDLTTLLNRSDILSLHAPLSKSTYHLINEKTIQQMKKGVMLINTSRGAVIDTIAVIEALKKGQIGYLGLDVYEEEDLLFFEDFSQEIIQDDVFARLLTFPNVVITTHQGFFTKEALEAIAHTTLENIHQCVTEKKCNNDVCSQHCPAKPAIR
ncbi:MAG: 2-hydroxyacid dehydrogenase [Parachlamydiales bacterium]|nr:2-hydroxyacid dehydrogenase [Parachlamydiales bacterium]